MKQKKRSRLKNEKAKKQTLIQGRYQHQKSNLKVKKLSTAGHLWEDDNFLCCKMDEYFTELSNKVGGGAISQKKIVICWIERWEKKKVGPTGDVVLEAKLVQKCAGLQWLDPNDTQSKLFTAHPDKMLCPIHYLNN